MSSIPHLKSFEDVVALLPKTPEKIKANAQRIKAAMTAALAELEKKPPTFQTVKATETAIEALKSGTKITYPQLYLVPRSSVLDNGRNTHQRLTDERKSSTSDGPCTSPTSLCSPVTAARTPPTSEQHLLHYDPMDGGIRTHQTIVPKMQSNHQTRVIRIKRTRSTSCMGHEELAYLQTAFHAVTSPNYFVLVTHVDKEMRDAAKQADNDFDKYDVDNFTTNRKLMTLVQDALTNDGESLQESQRYMLQEMLDAYRRRGVELEGVAFEKATALQKEILELSNQYTSNISEDTKTVTATREQLRGVPEDVIETFARTEEDTFTLKPDFPTHAAISNNCEDADTRQRMTAAWLQRGHPANDAVLRDVIRKRHELASLLVFESYAHLSIDAGMAKTPDNVNTFLWQLMPGLGKKHEQELAVLKESLPESVELDEQGRVKLADNAFLMEQYTKKHLQVDNEKVKEFFPLEATLQGLFDIYSKFFGLTFKDLPGAGELLWHKDMRALELSWNREGREELLGWVVLDLFPRDGKYTHVCCNELVRPHMAEDGSWAPCATYVLANFNKPTEDRPALLSHANVVSFFHEFGHAIHSLCGRCELPTFSGFLAVPLDFCELPSQLLEHWMWQPKILKSVAKHYKTGERLPDDLINSMVKARHCSAGWFYLRQISLACISLELYSKEAGQKVDELDLQAFRESIETRVLPHIAPNPDSHKLCNFCHLMGYGAQYYGYLWTEVFAADVFETILCNDGLLDPVWGKKYVDCIIGRGGGCDNTKMLVDFLGREPDSAAFMRLIGLADA